MKRFKITLALISLLLMQSTFAQMVQRPSQKVLLYNSVTNCMLRYYYYPNIEAYFDTQKNIYYFKENGKWNTATEIPAGYRGYSMLNKYNVSITDYDEDNICQFINAHKKKYPYITHEKSKLLNVSNE